MACPKCKCKVTYHYSDGYDGDMEDDFYEKCSYCGLVFDIEFAADDDDDLDNG